MNTELQLKTIEDFNRRVISAHNDHIINGECQLIDRSPNASPNGNQIYHLYSDGNITFQKGAYAYLNRSEFTSERRVTEYHNKLFRFVEHSDLITYAVLTKEQCNMFRSEMVELVSEMEQLQGNV